MDSTVMCQTPQSQLTLSAELRKVIHERNILTTRTRMKVLSELDGITRHCNEESQMSRRDKTIQEILTSEVSYLHQLELLTQYFMEPLKAMPCISSVEYMTLFGHVDTIYKVNGELLNEMKKTPNNIGEVFLKLAPFFKLYSVYAYDYKNVLKLLQDMQSNNPQLKEFIQQQETLPEVGTSLPALLITPIQRVPRYRLLLQEVLSLTPSNHPDHSIIQRSLLEVERTASHINNLVQEQESMQQMVELQRSLQNGRPSIVVPGRRLLKEGLLMKVSPHGKRAHCRYFVLFNDMLMYCKVVKPAAHRPRLLRCCCVLPLKKCRVDDVIGKGMFKVTCQGETLLLYSASLEDTQGWVTALTAAVKQYHESRQTLRRDSSNRKPMRQGDFTLDLPTPTLNVKCRKRRRSAAEDTGGVSSSTSQENIFKKFIWRKSLQANPEKIAKFEGGDSTEKTENPADYKDSLYPLRDSLTRGKKINSSENVAVPCGLKDISEESNIVKPVCAIESSGLKNEDCNSRKDPSEDVPDCVGFSIGARERMWNTMANLGRLIRKCIFRRVPRAPAFE